MKQMLLALILLLLFACSPSQKLADVTLNVNVLNNNEYRIHKIKVTSSGILQQLIDIKFELEGIEIVVILQSDFGHNGKN